jgi:hypothetical protein
MAQTGTLAAERLGSIFRSGNGVSSKLGLLSESGGGTLERLADEQIVAQNVAAELMEKSTGTRYPAVHLYCEKVVNRLTEKFRVFSGTVRLVIEVRVSQDRLDALERRVQYYVDAVTAVLDGHRGDWGEGMYYAGAYEIVYSAVKHGGRNFLQVAKISIDVDVSR